MELKLYFADLADYNAGILTGQWFDLADYDDESDLLEDVNKMLEQRSEATGELHEEWAVHDYDLPIDISEWPDLSYLFEIKEALSNDLPEDVLCAGLELDIPVDRIKDAFLGAYRTREDWAYEYIEDSGELEKIPDYLQIYFNYDAYARDCEINGHILCIRHKGQVYVFSGNF